MKREELKKIILLIKLDSEALYNRVIFREDEYIRTMALKRTKSHLGKIFRCRYFDLKIDDLKHLEEAVILEIEKFYNEVEELGWYLTHTEDMPATVEDKVGPRIKEIEKNYESMKLYLEAELNNYKEAQLVEDEGPPSIKYTD